MASKAEIVAYIRQAAIARGIDPAVALRVAMGEGGVTNPFRRGEGPAPRSQAAGFGRTENSFGPFQLYISGTGAGLGDRALKAGVDPRTNWKGGVDFALDEVSKKGWGQWYGARAAGITGMMGVGGRRTAPAGVYAAAPAQQQGQLPATLASFNMQAQPQQFPPQQTAPAAPLPVADGPKGQEMYPPDMSAYAGLPDGPKGQESYPMPQNALAAQPVQQPQPQAPQNAIAANVAPPPPGPVVASYQYQPAGPQDMTPQQRMDEVIRRQQYGRPMPSLSQIFGA